MTIKELIELLKQFDENLEIVIQNVDGLSAEYWPVDEPQYNHNTNQVVI